MSDLQIDSTNEATITIEQGTPKGTITLTTKDTAPLTLDLSVEHAELAVGVNDNAETEMALALALAAKGDKGERGDASYTLSPATREKVGGVIVGDGISLNEKGLINVERLTNSDILAIINRSGG